MSSLPAQHPTVSVHLTDATLTPLITSSSSQSHLESLTSLTTSALTAQTAVRRANLGRAQRIMVEYPDRGAVVLQTYLEPQELQHQRQQQENSSSLQKPTSSSLSSSSSSRPGEVGAEVGQGLSAPLSQRAMDGQAGGEDQVDRAEDAAPTLVGVVVARSAEEASEARRAAARLERLGREFQREWATEAVDGGGPHEASASS